MHQQINLYQPIFREERKLFSLTTVAASLCALLVVLLAIWGVGRYQVDKLAEAVDQLKQRQAAQQRMATSMGAMFEAQGSAAELQATVQLLNAQLAERTKALETLNSGVAGEPRGFALRMAALARQHASGVWLEELFLGSGPSGLMLRGRCTDAELLPKYLQLLAREEQLAGARFDEVVIDRRKQHDAAGQNANDQDKEDDPLTVRFSVSSLNALRQIPEYGK